MNKGLMIAAILAVAAMAGIAIAKLAPSALASATSPGGDPTDDYGCRTAWGIISPGEYTGTVRGLRVQLVEVLTAQGPENIHPAIFRIYAPNGQLIEERQINPINGNLPDDDTGEFLRGSYGNRNYYLADITNAPGFTLNATWAEVLFTVCRL